MKISKEVQYFPNIFRFIPEMKLNKTFNLLTLFSIGVSFIFILGLIFVSLSLYKNINNLFFLLDSKKVLQTKNNFWKSVVQRYDGYKDAYFQQAVIKYQLGEIEAAKDANTKALLLDPNFYDAKKLEEVMESK